MATGLKALHEIDRAISKARRTVSSAAKLPREASTALADVSRKQARAYGDIARLRLELLDNEGGGGDLGYVDHQAAKLLQRHDKEEARIAARAETSLEKITKLETERRAQEKIVAKAVGDYDLAAEACQKKLVADPDYILLLAAAEDAEATTERARAKQELAVEEALTKGTPYKDDPFFSYLQNRAYGTKQAKGWFLTRMFDGLIARKLKFRDAALNFKRLNDIPVRLAGHVSTLEGAEDGAREALKTVEQDMLIAEGVTKARKTSLSQQGKLDTIDAKLEAQEEQHQVLRAEQAGISAGDSAPYREAINLLVNTLKRKDAPDLRRLAAQTVSRDDDRAVNNLLELSRHARDLEDDQKTSRRLLEKHQKSLGEMERLRRKFKNRRYDAPSSQFPSGSLISSLLGQLIAGMLSSGDVWRQIERAQRTVRRRSDNDFGGIDWTEAMRLPRNSGGFGDIFGGGSSRGSGGIFGSGGGSRRRPRARRPAPRRRSPRRSSPRPAPRKRGGFRTGGGF